MNGNHKSKTIQKEAGEKNAEKCEEKQRHMISASLCMYDIESCS